MLFNVVDSSALPSSSEIFLLNIKSLKWRKFWTVTLKKRFVLAHRLWSIFFAVKCHLVLFGCLFRGRVDELFYIFVILDIYKVEIFKSEVLSCCGCISYRALWLCLV